MSKIVHFIVVKAKGFEGAISEVAGFMKTETHIAAPQKYMLAVVSQDDKMLLLQETEFSEDLTIEKLNNIFQDWISEDAVGYAADFLDKTFGKFAGPAANREYLNPLSPCSMRALGNYLMSAAAIKTFRRNYGDAEADVLYQDFNACELDKCGVTNLADSIESAAESGRGENANLNRYAVVIRLVH